MRQMKVKWTEIKSFLAKFYKLKWILINLAKMALSSKLMKAIISGNNKSQKADSLNTKEILNKSIAESRKELKSYSIQSYNETFLDEVMQVKREEEDSICRRLFLRVIHLLYWTKQLPTQFTHKKSIKTHNNL